MRRLLIAALALASTSVQASLPTTSASACPKHALAGEVRCVTIRVPENPRRPSGRQISLEVMILAARTANGTPDPLFVLPGGPGQSATRAAGPRAYFAEVFDAIRETRDIVLIAPRGTAGSNELNVAPPPDLLFASLDTVFPPEWSRAARDELSQRTDLTQYTTSNIVGDLELTRQALGYEHINIYGTSYGTRVAQLYAARYPQRVRAMILKAPVPPGTPVPLTYTSGAERALRAVFARCAIDARCNARYPNLSVRFDALMARLAADPVQVSAPLPATGGAVSFRISDTVFGLLLRNVLMSASGARQALQLIDQADKGDFRQAAALIVQVRTTYASDLSLGMALSVIATEDIAPISARDLEADAAAGFLRGAVARGMIAATRGWPRGEAPADLYQPLSTTTPVLIVAGAYDPATPPAFAQRIAATLPNVRVLVFPGGSHSANNFTGLDRIMTQFVASADARALDVSAVEANQPVPLVED